MAKRLTPFIGLAVVAALALAAAFGAFSLSPAFAGSEAPNARGLAQPLDFQSQAATNLPVPVTAIETSAADTPVTTIVEGDNPAGNMRLRVGQSVTIDLNDSIKNTAAVIDGAATNINAFRLNAPAAGAAGNGVVTIGSPSTDGVTTGNIVVAMQTSNTRVSTSTEVTITGAAAGVATLTITAFNYDTTPNPPTTGDVEHSTRTFSVVVLEPELVLTSENTSANTRQDVTFLVSSDLSAGTGEITIELEDFGFPGSVDVGSVGLLSDAWYATSDYAGTPSVAEHNPVAVSNTVAGYNTMGNRLRVAGAYQSGVVSPTDVTVSGEEIKISVPDMNPETDRAEGITAGDLISVVLRQGSGITNPSEGKGVRGDPDADPPVVETGYTAKISNNVDDVEQESSGAFVPRRVVLSEEDGGRGTSVTATGHGFKNGTSLGFFLDENTNGRRDAGEVTLCDVAQVSSNDTGSCTFTVNNPPFGVGDNFVGAVDGRGQGATKSATNNHGDQKFELTPTISASPASGNPGDSILVQMYDFPASSTVSRVDLARQVELGNRPQDSISHNGGATGTDGSANFRLTVPNWAPEGVLDLKVTAGGKSDNITITIGGPVVRSTPSTVLANQRINLVGTGFTPNSRVCCGAQVTGEDAAPLMTIGGETIPVGRINDGDDVRVDSGGNWSASIDLPLTQVTSDEGVREIVVRDSRGRSGSVDVTVPARSVTIDPPTGRGGTVAVVRGENFPSKNDSGDSFNIEITYTSSAGNLRVSTTPDASGRFETDITIPRLATIPSTNTVQVVYEYGDNDIPVTTTVTHQVPEGELSLSQSSGPPGTVVTVRGQGFRTTTPVTSVEIGDIEIPLSPAPYTTGQGGLDFDITIPDLDTGVQTIEVSISGGTTASIGFTVTPGDAAGAETPAAEAVANMGDNFVRAFYFNNTTKTWTFYDPEVADASTLENFIAGASYWVLVGADQDVILNRNTRNLTCADGNCWNLIVW